MAEEPVCAQKGPYQIEVKAGQAYFWCACGKSRRQPFCDGSHKGSGLEPMKWVAETAGTVNFCGCKSSDDKPHCDGTHNML